MSNQKATKKYRKKKKLGHYPFFSVIFSITLALSVIALFAFFLLTSLTIGRQIQENVQFQIFLKKDLPEADRDKLRAILGTRPYVNQKEDAPQITFKSKEQTAEDFIKDTGEDFTSMLGDDNPFRDAYLVNIKPAYHHIDSLKQVQADIEGQPTVFEVEYREGFITSVNNNVNRIILILGAFALILIITVILLINNTIKLALFSQRFLIRSMQLVGGTAGFIKRPFLKRSVLHGFVSAVAAAALVALLFQYLSAKYPFLANVLMSHESLYIAAGLLVTGVLLSFFSTLRAINKYLKMSLDELY